MLVTVLFLEPFGEHAGLGDAHRWSSAGKTSLWECSSTRALSHVLIEHLGDQEVELRESLSLRHREWHVEFVLETLRG